MNLVYRIKAATEKEIFIHLTECNDSFKPPLNKRVNLKDFSKKIYEKAVTFEAWENKVLVGLLSGYFNNVENRYAYINNVSVIQNYMGKGIASNLLNMCIDYAKHNSFIEIHLEVSENNTRAICLYKKFGFQGYENRDKFLLMKHIVG